MPQFNYTAVNREGQRIQGAIDAATEAEVRIALRAQQLRPVRIARKSALEVDLFKLGGGGTKTRPTDVLLFTRQFSILLSSGIPLVQGLEIIGSQMKSPGMKRVVMLMKEKITTGSFLWESMSEHKKTFSQIYVSMIRAGEASGALDVILQRMIKYLDDAEKVKKLVKSAMVYPVTVVIIGIVVVIGMLAFVIPKFEDLLKQSGQELPAPTQFVISASHFVQGNFLWLVLGTAAAVYFTRRFLNTPEGKRFFDYYILKAPLFGPLMNKVAVARFSRTMQTLLSSGVNLLDALDICRTAIGNRTIEDTILKIKGEVEQGKTLSAIMAKIPYFPPMAVQMVTVGENTGNIDKMLERVADWYEEEVKDTVGNLTKLMEPLILVFLGGMVGGLLIAMYLPIFKMSAGGAQ